MTDEKLTYAALTDYLNDLLEEIIDRMAEDPSNDEYDLIHELVDGSEYVIYNYRAEQVLDLMNFEEQEDAYREARQLEPQDLTQLKTWMVFEFLRQKLTEKVQDWMDEREMEEADHD